MSMMGGQGVITGAKHPVMLTGATIARHKVMAIVCILYDTLIQSRFPVADGFSRFRVFLYTVWAELGF